MQRLHLLSINTDWLQINKLLITFRIRKDKWNLQQNVVAYTHLFARALLTQGPFLATSHALEAAKEEGILFLSTICFCPGYSQLSVAHHSPSHSSLGVLDHHSHQPQKVR